MEKKFSANGGEPSDIFSLGEYRAKSIRNYRKVYRLLVGWRRTTRSAQGVKESIDTPSLRYSRGLDYV